MGDPRKHRRKYEGPPHPWQAARIEQEKVYVSKYGIARKNEIWKMASILRSFKRQAKNLIIRTDSQSKKEEELLLKKLYGLGLLDKDAKLENILDIDTPHILERRLQTVVANKGLAHSPKQARQFITHRHINVKGKMVNVPSYLVKRDEEDQITFAARSPFINAEHPERVAKKEERPAAPKVPSAPHRKEQRVEKKAMVVEVE